MDSLFGRIFIAGSPGPSKIWLLPVNLAFWVLVSSLLFRLRTLRGFAVCMAIAQTPRLLLFPSLL